MHWPFLILFHRDTCDKLVFYDGYKQKKMIDEYNGKTDPQPVTSLSDRMLIHFTSNDAIRFSGFELEYLEYRK